jgi:putative membrane protein
MRILLKILITAGALLLVAYLIPGIEVESFLIALLVAFLLAVINLTIRPIILLLTLPISLLTLGLFTLVINGFLFWLTATFVEGFSVSGFWVAVFGAFVVSVFKWFGDKVVKS